MAFWERRIRRLFPALVVVTLATLVAGWFLLLPVDYVELAQSVFSQMLLCSNFFFWTHTNYFDGAADLKPMLHSWSLSVEEQFYLLYPFVLILLTKVRRQLAVMVVAILFCIGLTFSIYGVSHDPRAAFYLLPFRAWELGLGAILVAVQPGKFGLVWFNEALSTIGLASIPVRPYQGSTRTRGPVYGDQTRLVWVADSFEGLPKPDGRYQQDAGDRLWEAKHTLGVADREHKSLGPKTS